MQSVQVTFLCRFINHSLIKRWFSVYKSCSGGNVTERIALKQRLKCKNFRWYLKHIYPESCLNNEFVHFGEVSQPIVWHQAVVHTSYSTSVTYHHFSATIPLLTFFFSKAFESLSGNPKLQIRNSAKKRCLDARNGNVGSPVKLYSCHKKGGNQVFGLTKSQKIITMQEHCIGVVKNSVVIANCMQAPRWNYDPKVLLVF